MAVSCGSARRTRPSIASSRTARPSSSSQTCARSPCCSSATRSVSVPSIVSRPSTTVVMGSLRSVRGLRTEWRYRVPGAGRAAAMRGRSVVASWIGSSIGTTSVSCRSPEPYRTSSRRPSLVPLAVKVAAGETSLNRKLRSPKVSSVSAESDVVSCWGVPSMASASVDSSRRR